MTSTISSALPDPPERPDAAEPGESYSGPFRELFMRFATGAAIYTTATVVTRAGSLLLLPVYWRYLDPADYGILTGTAVLISVLSSILGFGLSDAISRFYWSWAPNERKRRVGTVWVCQWAITAAIGLPLLLFGGPLLDPLMRNVPFDPYLRAGVAIGMLNSFAGTGLSVLRITDRRGGYVGVSLAAALVQHVVALLLVIRTDAGALGVLWGQLIAAASAVLIAVPLMLRYATPAFNRLHAGEVFRYASPLVPAAALDSGTSVVDRIILDKYVSAATLGLYGVADTVASAVRIVAAGVKTSWIPFQMRLASQRTDGPAVMARTADWVALVLLLTALATFWQGGDLVAAIGNPKYAGVVPMVGLLVLPHVLAGMYHVLGSGFAIARRTEYAAAITGTHLTISAAVAIMLIPTYGVWGAGIANICGYAARLGLSVVISQRLYRIPFRWPVLAAIGFALPLIPLTIHVLPPFGEIIGVAVRGLTVTAIAALSVVALRSSQRRRPAT